MKVIGDSSRRAHRDRGLPWLDHSGRFSPLKLVVLVGLFVPIGLVAYRYGHGDLGARPLNEAIHRVGNWTLRLVFLSLAVTPLSRILQWPRLMLVRRMIGVAAFLHAAVHLALYVVDQGWDVAKVASEIVLRVYLTIGFVALLILAAMAATSTDGMMRRLGGRRWRRLHRLVYAGALLAVVHFFLQTKAAVDEPWVMAGLYGWLMGYRLVAGRLGADRAALLWSTGALGVGAALLTAVGEAVYYGLKVGVDPTRLLLANLTVETGVRPAWVVLSITAAIAALGALRAAQAGFARRRLRTT